ncbi:hypothetical protein AAF712_003991 [Marasmius tenuissimus]|uniref:Uncharacterized protein n=1 Tax=Marasmius tenuissimus TaxID=585030 RepID=A0ABR3A5R5_9AGAR
MNLGWRSLVRKRNRSFHLQLPFFLPIRGYVEDVFESPSQFAADLRRNRQLEFRANLSQSKGLASLIKDGHHRMALATRDEMLNNGKDIPWDDSFFEAAHYALGESSMESSFPSFVKWIDLLPTAGRYSRAQHENFARLQNTLANHQHSRVDFLYQFALILAGKGYRDFVQDRLMPLIKEQGTPEMIHDLKFQLLPTKLSSTSFADVFEPEDDEYSANYLESPVSEVEDVRAGVVKRLHECIEAGLLDEARTILSELESINHSVPPHSLYEKAAAMALTMNGQDRSVVQDSFMLFFPHVPPLHQQPSETATPILETIQMIIRDHSLILPQVALVLASKGYAPLLSPIIFPTLLRTTPPESARPFLGEYERLNEEYQRERPASSKYFKLRYVPPEPGMRLALSLKAIRESAIRALADIGHLELAVDLIPGPDQRAVRLSQRIYSRLLTALEKRRDYLKMNAGLNQIAKLNALLGKVRPMYYEASQEALPYADLDMERPHVLDITTTTHLANAIRLVKASLPFNAPRRKRARRVDGPTMVKILTVLSSPDVVLENPSGLPECISTTRPNLLRLLRRRALLSNERATKMWLFCEMVHLWHERRYGQIIRIFRSYFWCYGVPAREVESVAHSQPSPWDSQWVRLMVQGIPEKGILPKPKFYPTAYQHTSLVWQSLVMFHEDNKGKISELYRRMVFYARAYHEASKQLSGDDTTVLDAPYTPSLESDSESGSSSYPIIAQENPFICVENFTPFIRQLSPGPGRRILGRRDLDPTKIIRDMMSLGLRPTIHQYTELARKYILNSDGNRALTIMDHLERVNFHQDSVAPRNSSLPEPDVIFYVALMRAFLNMNDLEGVAEVDRRLMSRHGSLEALLASLEKKKQTERVKEDVDTIVQAYEDWELLEGTERKDNKGTNASRATAQ